MKSPPQSLVDVLKVKVKPPVAIVLGAKEVLDILDQLRPEEAVCYQMDLFAADRLRDSLAELGLPAKVIAASDAWDVPGSFASAIYPAPKAGERSLKIDMVEQAFHMLRPGGTLYVLSPYEKDELFSPLLKKVFGQVHATSVGNGSVFWGTRRSDRPRRRHEITYHVQQPEAPSLVFVSRPGVFSYGRLDMGARALIDSMAINPGDAILDLGCGCGTNGVSAGRRAGVAGSVAFLDSNVRAIALADINAVGNGLSEFTTHATWRPGCLPRASVDVVLANPPYYGQGEIAERFVEHARGVLRPQGRLYLVTKQPEQIGDLLLESFTDVCTEQVRGYEVFCAEGVR